MFIKNDLKKINGKEYLAVVSSLDNGQIAVSITGKKSDYAKTYYLDGCHLDDVLCIGRVNSLMNYCNSHQVSLSPAVNADNKTVATGEQVGVINSEGDALHSSECRSTLPVEGSAFTEQDNKGFPKWGVTLRGLPLPTQAPPLTAENKNNSFIFRIMNGSHWVVLRHDWDDKNIYIHSAKYQTTFFEMCTQDNEKRSIAVPYSPHNLTLLLSARTCPALIHLAQSLSNDAQEVEQ